MEFDERGRNKHGLKRNVKRERFSIGTARKLNVHVIMLTIGFVFDVSTSIYAIFKYVYGFRYGNFDFKYSDCL